METLILIYAVVNGAAVISEVCANAPDDTCGEFVEIYNNSPDILDVAGYTITDGDALDGLYGWSGDFPHTGVVTGTTLIPPWGYAVLLEEDYPNDPWLSFAPGTVILTTGDHAICNGLAASSDPLTLFNQYGTSPANVVSTFGTPLDAEYWQDRDDDGLDSIPFDPGTGNTLFRYPLEAPDCEMTWFVGLPTPGGPPEAPPDTFAILIDSLYISDIEPLPFSSITLSAIVSCWGTVSPDQGFITLYIDHNGDSIPQPAEILLEIPASSLSPGDTQEIQAHFTAPEQGWYPAVCSTPSGEARLHFKPGGGVNPVITEVMANPLIQTQEEYFEVYYPGPGVFPLAGCKFTDGDAVDDIIPWVGGPYIQSGQVVLVIDPDYIGTLDIPPETPLFTPANSNMGNGLTTDDPILLYGHGEPSLANLLSTAGTPLLFDDPLACDDDGLDGIPFDPGQGHSMEKIIPTGPDAEFNWRASVFGGTPGVIPDGQGWVDLRTDTVTFDGTSLFARFSNCGALPGNGTATLFSDLNGNLLPDPGEVIYSFNISLDVGESDSISLSYTPPDSGLFTIAAGVFSPEDTVYFNNTRHMLLIPSKPAWPVVTEVLCNPTDQKRDEFVEVFFPGPGQVDMTLFIVTDFDAEDILVADETPFLTPGQYGLILDPDYVTGTQPYDIPPGTVILYPGNSTIGDGLAGNDPVALLYQSEQVSTYGTPDDPYDEIPYNPGKDLSVERISPYMPDQASSWFTSPLGPTPGRPPRNLTEGVDYTLTEISLSPPMGPGGTSAFIQASLTSTGTDSVPQGLITVVIKAGGEVLHQTQPSPPAFGDTISVSAFWEGVSGVADVSAYLVCPPDGNTSNDTISTWWNPSPTLCINEIFYHDPEWVELFNATGESISLCSLTFSDPSRKVQLPAAEVAPGEYVVLTGNLQAFENRWGQIASQVIETDGWPILNNTGDSLFLESSSGTLDMVPYTSSWGGNAASSLERRSPEVMGFVQSNWGTCTGTATPGQPNSIGHRETTAFLTAEPRVFNPPGSPLIITLNLPMQACNATVKVFDVRGMELLRLYDGIVPGETLVLQWDGDGYPVGRYIIHAESHTGEKQNDACVVVLARPLR